jgi:site-specific recombinase XerD
MPTPPSNERNLRVPIARFLRYLSVERNFSDYTIKSYREDLEAWLEYELAARDGLCPRPDQISTLELRGYLAAMREAERIADDPSVPSFSSREDLVRSLES